MAPKGGFGLFWTALKKCIDKYKQLVNLY